MRIAHFYTNNDDKIFGYKSLVYDYSTGMFVLVDRDDEIYAAGGNDTILSGGGDDIIHAGSGSDFVDGGTGNDTIHGDQGQDTIFGGDGHDHINAGTDGGRVDGGAGNDTINGANYGTGQLNNGYQIDGGAGHDKIIGGFGSDSIDGGSGNDTLYITFGGDLMLGGTGNDTFVIDAPTANLGYRLDPFEILDGGSGYDTLDLRATDGDQLLYSWVYSSTVAGVSGFEKILTGSGNDEILHMEGVEFISSGWGNDTVTAGVEAQVLIGGAGVDTLILQYVWGTQTGVTLHTDESLSHNAYFGAPAPHYIRGFENYTLTSKDDRFYGADKGEMVELGFGDDTAFGRAGNDDLRGDKGDDFLNGGAGNDMLTGGSDADEFHFDIDKPFGHDTITDFEMVDQLTFESHGFHVGAMVVRDQGDDAVVTFLGMKDSSVTVIGAAGLPLDEFIELVGGFEILDFGEPMF